jgi:hypothetical protein
VDLEQQQPVDLLPDRSADTLVRWFQAHPGVEIISRDRANDYAEGASRGAPKAIQVADFPAFSYKSGHTDGVYGSIGLVPSTTSQLLLFFLKKWGACPS